jgi:hypothetical protein
VRGQSAGGGGGGEFRRCPGRQRRRDRMVLQTVRIYTWQDLCHLEHQISKCKAKFQHYVKTSCEVACCLHEAHVSTDCRNVQNFTELKARGFVNHADVVHMEILSSYGIELRIMNKKSRKADKEWSSSSPAGRVA